MAIVLPSSGRSARARRGVAQGAEVADHLVWQLRILATKPGPCRGLGFAREYRFHRTRAWRFDVACPSLKIGVEIHGGVFAPDRGAHSRGARQIGDWEKANEAQLAGWIVLSVLPEWVKKGRVVVLVERAIEQRQQTDGL